MMLENEIILALPKGRILSEIELLFRKIGIILESDFYNKNSRKLLFSCNIEKLKIIRTRSFDIATFVKFGAADIGICGLDVLKESSSSYLYDILDLNIGKCYLAIAGHKDSKYFIEGNHKDSNFLLERSHIRIATKYVNLTEEYFLKLGIQADCIKLHGAMEIAPILKLSDLIVDLVSTGETLKINNLKEIDKIMNISSRLIANCNSFKVKNSDIVKLIKMLDIENKIIN